METSNSFEGTSVESRVQGYYYTAVSMLDDGKVDTNTSEFRISVYNKAIGLANRANDTVAAAQLEQEKASISDK